MPSILFLTVHKAGSSFFAGQVLPPLAKELRLRHRDIAGDMFRRGGNANDIDFAALKGQRDVIVGPLRRPELIGDPRAYDDWKTIIVLRDPRDVLVSLYFSLAFSHALPPGPALGDFLATRARVQKMSLDKFALARARTALLPRYTIYVEQFLGRPNTLLLRYEDVIGDWPGALGTMIDFIGLPVTPEWRRKMLELQSELNVGTEDPSSHKRQVAPGDAMRKLKPQTIERLNELLSVPLKRLGYT